jgi:AcrR family transcriptional regulator
MANFVTKWVRRSGKRRSGGSKQDGKIWALTEAGLRLLALKDYDAISMAQIAREAGCSVGALYARYPEKTNYLYRVVAAGLRSLQEQIGAKLEAKLGTPEPPSATVSWTVRVIVEAMASRKAAGVIRAGIKLSTVKPDTAELFEDYRHTVTDKAVALLAPKFPKTNTQAIRIAVQIVMATVTDAVLQKKPGPMLAGTQRMDQALTEIVAGYLDPRGAISTQDTDDEDDTPVEDELTEAPPTDGSTPVFDPEFRRYVRKKTAAPKKTPPSELTPLPSSGGRGATISLAQGIKQASARQSKPPGASVVGKADRVSSDTQSASQAPPSVEPKSVSKKRLEPAKPKRRHRFI